MYQTLSEIFKHDFQRQFCDLSDDKNRLEDLIANADIVYLDSAMDPTVYPVRAIVFHKKKFRPHNHLH